jgi:hypothetical protein
MGPQGERGRDGVAPVAPVETLVEETN